MEEKSLVEPKHPTKNKKNSKIVAALSTRVVIVVSCVLLVGCSVSSLLFIVRLKAAIDELGADPFLFVSPYALSGSSTFPCVWMPTEVRPDQGSLSHECPGSRYFCPLNYTCNRMGFSKLVCLYEKSDCGGPHRKTDYTEDCYNYLLSLTSRVPNTKSLFFEFPNPQYITSLCFQSVSLCLILLVSVIFYKSYKPRGPIPSSTLFLYLTVLIPIICTLFYVTPTIITFLSISPKFERSRFPLDLFCFSSPLLYTHVWYLVGLVICCAISGPLIVILFVTGATHFFPEVYYGFWNGRSATQIGVWIGLLCGLMTILVLSLHTQWE